MWLTSNFIDKSFYAPFKITKDCEYYEDLRKKYSLVIKKAREAGANDEHIRVLKKCKDKILKSIRMYYDGNITTTHRMIKNLVAEVKDDKLAVTSVNSNWAFRGSEMEEVQFFRGRLSDNYTTYSKKEMIHLPFELRGKTRNERFSILGVPCLYLSNTSYGCWLELGCPADHKFNVSPILVKEDKKVLNLAVHVRELLHLNSFENNRVVCWLKLIMLMIATSYVVEEKDRTFNSEYIVSQSIMLACKDLGIDGVAYFSKRVSNEVFAIPAVNVVFFAGIRKNGYSKLCEDIKIDDSYNFAMFKKLSMTYMNYSYRFKLDTYEYGFINIGSFDRQYKYQLTEFYKFDSFIYSSWKNKDEIEWGHFIKEDM